MSDLTDRIASKHTVNGIGGGGTTRIETIWCSCGAKTQSHVTEGYGRGFAQHIADVTEQAAREQIAAELHRWAAIEDERCCWSYAEIWQEAAEIARGEAWAVIHAGKTVENRSRNIAGDYRDGSAGRRGELNA